MVKRNFIVTFLLFTLFNFTFIYQAISSSLEDAIGRDTEEPKSKKRKLDDVTSDQSTQDDIFITVYEHAKSLLQRQPISQYHNVPQQVETVDSFLKILGDTYRYKIIDRMIQEYGAEKLKEHSGLVSVFLKERAQETYTLQSLSNFKNAVRIGYEKFSYKPLTNDLKEVLIHLALVRSFISTLWAPRSYENQNRSFVFQIPTPLTGTAEAGQLQNLAGSSSELTFSFNCLDLSHTQLSFQLFREFAGLQPQLHGKFSMLKLDQMSIGDSDFQILHPFLFQGGFSSLSCNGNQLTSEGLYWFLMTSQKEIRKNGIPSTLLLRENNITDVNQLVEIFKESSAPQHEGFFDRAYSSNMDYEAKEEPILYNFSSLKTLDLSGNPFTKEAIKYLLNAFVKSPPQRKDYYSSVYSNTPLFFSETTIVLKDIASLKGSEQEIKDCLTNKPLMFKVILDDAFMPSK